MYKIFSIGIKYFKVSWCKCFPTVSLEISKMINSHNYSLLSPEINIFIYLPSFQISMRNFIQIIRIIIGGIIKPASKITPSKSNIFILTPFHSKGNKKYMFAPLLAQNCQLGQIVRRVSLNTTHLLADRPRHYSGQR